MRPHSDMNALNLDTYSLSLITAKEDILNDRISTDWAVFTYERKWSLKLMDSGVGGLEELTKRFNRMLVQYGLCRVPDPNTQLPRFILIYWVGEHVDASRKEISTQHLPAIRRFFKEAGVMLRAQRIEEISQEVVTQALNKLPQPTRHVHRPRLPGSHEVVGTNYTKTNPAIEMKFSMRDSFWQRNEREEERRKEQERLRLQEERIAMEKARIERERLEEEERERRIQEKERMVEEQRREQARLEAEQRRLEKARWAQQQKEFEEEMKGRFRRSQSIEMAAEAAALVSGRSLHPRDIFRQHERSVSCSNSPPSTPSSPLRSPSSFSNRTTFRYQRSMTESILTPPARSPSYFPGFQKRDSFSGPSTNTPPACSPAFIFSKSPLPGTSPKVESLPSFIPPPISTKRGSPSHAKENISPQSSISPPQSSISAPQSSISAPQSSISPPQSSMSTPQSFISPIQSSISPPQSSISAPQSFTSPIQSSISPPQSSISAPQSFISPTQSSISAPQGSISAPQSSISPPQSSISPPRSSISPTQSSISAPQSFRSPPSSISPPQSTISPPSYLYDVPYRAEYVTLTSEESPQQNSTYSEKKVTNIKAPTRPPALKIPPSTNIDTPDAANILSDVYRAEFVPVDNLSTSEDLVEPGHSPKSLRGYQAPEGPAAIKATVSVSTPVSEIAFANVIPDPKISTSPLSTEAPGLNLPPNAKAIEPTFAPQKVVPEPGVASQASSTSAALSDQRTLPSPPVSVTAGNPPETKSYFYPISSYESRASSKTAPVGLLPSPLPDSPITLEGKASPVSSSLKSILQYVAPPPYTPFSARTTDSITVKAPAFAKSLSSSSRLSSSNSGRNMSEILSTKVPNLEILTATSSNQPELQIPPCLGPQELTPSHLYDQPPPSQTEVTHESNDVQPVDLAPPPSLATVSQPESQPAEYKAVVSTVDNLSGERSSAMPQMELNEDQNGNLTLQDNFSSSNLLKANSESIYYPTEVSPAESSVNEPTVIINLPEPQIKAGVPPTEIVPSSASFPINIPPPSQTKNSEKQTEVLPLEPSPVVPSISQILPESHDELSLVEPSLVVASVSSILPESHDELSLVEPSPVVASVSGILPESQVEVIEKQTEVSPVESLPVVASPFSILPKSQDVPYEEQTEVIPVDSLPVVASLSSNLPESQVEVIEKQIEVPVETLPDVASLSSILPESQDENIEKQTEEALPVVASLSSILPEPQDVPCENQTEVSAVDPLPVASVSSILPESQDELTEKQNEFSPVESLPVMTSLPSFLPESRAEPSDFQTTLPVLPSFPETAYPPEPVEQQGEVLPMEHFPVSTPICPTFNPESQTEYFGDQTKALPIESITMDVSSDSQSVPRCNQTELPEIIPIPENLHTDSQLDDLVGDPPQFDPLPVPVSLPSEPEHADDQSGVPSVEVIHDHKSLLTDNSLTFEGPSKNQDQVLQPEASPVSITLPEFQCETRIHQTEVSADRTLHRTDCLSMDNPPEPHVEISSNKTEVPPLETLQASSILPPDSSPGYQAGQRTSVTDIPAADLVYVSPAIPQIQTEVPPCESLLLTSSPPLDGSLDFQPKTIKDQIDTPPLQSLSVTASLTANISYESPDELINNQSDLLVPETSPFSASIPTHSLLEGQSETYDRQPEILPSDIVPIISTVPDNVPPKSQGDASDTQDEVPSAQTLPVTASPCTKISPECQTDPEDEVPRVQFPPEATILFPDSSIRSEDGAVHTEAPVPLPVTLPIETSSESNQSKFLAVEHISLSFPPESLEEIRDIQTEFHPAEGKNESSSLPTEAELSDGQSEVLPDKNITEPSPLPTISLPHLGLEANGLPSESPLNDSLPGSVSLPLVQLSGSQAEFSLGKSEPDLQPDTFFASMVLCTDQSNESNIEGNDGQLSTETSLLPALFPSISSSESPTEPSRVPPVNPTSVTLLGGSPSTSPTDNPNTVSPLGSHWIPTNSFIKFVADPNGNLIEVESPPLCPSLLADTSCEFLPPPPPGISCDDEDGDLGAPLFCDSLPAPNLSLFEDPHPGSPPVTASGPETKAMATSEQSTDKVIVHDILPINNLPEEESQTPKDLSLCSSDLLYFTHSSMSADHNHSSIVPTEELLPTTENNIPDNNNTVPSQVVL